MFLPQAIVDNLRFLQSEVASQLVGLEQLFRQLYHQPNTEHQSPTQAPQYQLSQNTYSHQLKQRIDSACNDELANHAQQSKQSDNSALPTSLRSVSTVAQELERIATLTRQCAEQSSTLGSKHKLRNHDFIPLLAEIQRGVDLVQHGIQKSDAELALQFQSCAAKTHERYLRSLDTLTNKLKNARYPEDYITGIFIAQHINDMGHALQGISNATISRSIGHELNVDRYNTLRSTITDITDITDEQSIAITPIAETKSGSGISRLDFSEQQSSNKKKHNKKSAKVINQKNQPKGTQVEIAATASAIFKDGDKRKMKQELQGVESWHEVYPGVAPQVLTYKKTGNNAALLIEHLPGLTFEQLVLHGPQRLSQAGMSALKKTVTSVWKQTKQTKSCHADFIGQTRKRLAKVYAIHPYFNQSDSSLCGLELTSMNTLLEQAQAIERDLPAPFSVFIHGDFNLDNIIYDTTNKRITFIDLHRSRHMDYVQDISVFMVSNLRLQVLDKPVRRRIAKQALAFAKVGRSFAQKHDDKTFELRLALGLARSLITSTRFIIDRPLAERMFFSARYLLEQLLIQMKAPKKIRAHYTVPIKELFGD